MSGRSLLALLITVAVYGCSSSNSAASDAAPHTDAAPATVMAVTCPSGTVPTIASTDTNLSSYTPSSVSIGVGQIVKFTMSSEHNVVPNTIGMSDPGLSVDFGATKCLMFTKAGTFGFFCSVHGFSGTVVVQ